MDSNPNSPKVLVIDDEIGPRESLKMILKKNYRVLTAESGGAALSLLRTLKPDVITLDLRMAGISGMETLREIRKIDRHVNVIVVSGWATLLDTMETLCHGVSGYITKPFNIPEVIRMIEDSLAAKPALTTGVPVVDQAS